MHAYHHHRRIVIETRKFSLSLLLLLSNALQNKNHHPFTKKNFCIIINNKTHNITHKKEQKSILLKSTYIHDTTNEWSSEKFINLNLFALIDHHSFVVNFIKYMHNSNISPIIMQFKCLHFFKHH